MQYKQLINALEHGFHVMVKNSDGYLVISPIKDQIGDWRDSDWHSTPEKAKQRIGMCPGSTKGLLQIECPNWELVEVFTLPYKRWEAGDKVRIADNAEELCNKVAFCWNEKMQKMIGKKCEVRSLCYKVWDEYKSDFWLFPNEALLPVFDEEVEKMVEEMTVAQVCKELGREIKIIK